MNIIPKWTTIDSLGKSKISKNSYYWVLILPIIVSLLPENFNDFTLTIGGHDFDFKIKLPFKWGLLYMAGLCFGLATILYQLFCPSFIKLWRKYSDFDSAGYPHSYLLEEAENVGIRSHEDIEAYAVSEPVSTFNLRQWNKNRPVFNGPESSSIRNESLEYDVYRDLYKSNKQNSFNLILHKADQKFWFIRVLCTVLYLAGIFIITYLFIKNTIYVFNHFY